MPVQQMPVLFKKCWFLKCKFSIRIMGFKKFTKPISILIRFRQTNNITKIAAVQRNITKLETDLTISSLVNLNVGWKTQNPKKSQYQPHQFDHNSYHPPKKYVPIIANSSEILSSSLIIWRSECVSKIEFTAMSIVF